MLPRALNLDQIMSEGHDGIALPRPHYQTLLTMVQGLEWKPDPDGVFARIPTFLSHLQGPPSVDQFEKERRLNEQSLVDCPPDLLAAIESLLIEPQVMNNWLIGHQPRLRFISVWDGAEALDWHWDGPAGADFFFLIYLNNTPGWTEGSGGQLLTGRRKLDGNYLRVDGDQVDYLATYAPVTRSLICCNNQNPQFVHKVIPLRTAQERTVLMIGFDMVRRLCSQKSEHHQQPDRPSVSCRHEDCLPSLDNGRQADNPGV